MYTLLQGDCRQMLQTLPDESVQTVVTSPPYWGLRDYGVAEQLGLELMPDEYVQNMVEVFREVRRVLRSDGTLWLNVGDTYAANRSAQMPLKPKDLVGIPWRLAFAMQADGWYLRSDIIWNKPNPMPESVADRPTRAHEYLFLLSKSPRYYYDGDAIREPYAAASAARYAYKFGDDTPAKKATKNPSVKGGIINQNSAGRNKRTVWTVPTKSFRGAHFATFPPALIEPCILAGTSPQACPHCGAPWERVREANSGGTTGQSWHHHQADRLGKGNTKPSGQVVFATYRRGATIGWQPTCSCENNDGTGSCVILDPFSGAGTTGLVAMQHGRKYVGIEVNPAYNELAERRFAELRQQTALW